MEMGETSENRRSWEAEIYWTHFQSFHFTQFLQPGFHQQLAIPKKFTDNLKNKLSGTVSLKGPSGATWNVGLTANDDTLFLKHGWPEFVKDHSLEEIDMLIFKYSGESLFNVLMFDGQNLCEKEASYFVRHGHTKPDSECQIKKKMRESSFENTHTYPHDGVGDASPEKCANNDNVRIPSGHHNVTEATDKKIQRKARYVKLVNTQRSVKNKEPSTCAREVKAKRGAQHASISRITTYGPKFVSNRRPITEDEKKKALQLAYAVATDASFIAVMKPTSVYKRFYMIIPLPWVAKHLSLETQDVILCVNKDAWNVNFYYPESRGSGRLTSGWKNFAVQNYLEEFDVCVFEPCGRKKESVVINVHIFRVVNDLIIPATKVSCRRPPMKKARKKLH